MTILPQYSNDRLEQVSIAALKPHTRNARTHTKKQIRQIADSIARFGFTNPVLADGNDNIIAGHGRVAAARLLGLTHVPVLRLEGMSEEDRRAYIIADNQLAALAGWDEGLLALELEGILALSPDFDLTITGFETADIEAFLNGLENDPAEEDVVEVDERLPVVATVGDVWILGQHRLICGDSTDAEVFRRLMDGEKAQMVFTDAPYNVPVNGHICGLGKIQHDEFVMAAGEMSEAEFTELLATVMQNLADFSLDGSIHYHCMDWRHIVEIMTAGKSAYTGLKNLVVWNKDNGGMGAFYRSKHELVFVFKNGTAAHINNFGLGQHGRYRTNVWDYAGVNSMGANRAEELAMHPTVKPVAMVADAIRDCSKRDGIILDAFSGSGTTIIAAEQTKRRCHAIELDPRYVDVAIRRWQKVTGEIARLEGSDVTFDAAERLSIELDG